MIEMIFQTNYNIVLNIHNKWVIFQSSDIPCTVYSSISVDYLNEKWERHQQDTQLNPTETDIRHKRQNTKKNCIENEMKRQRGGKWIVKI